MEQHGWKDLDQIVQWEPAKQYLHFNIPKQWLNTQPPFDWNEEPIGHNEEISLKGIPEQQQEVRNVCE